MKGRIVVGVDDSSEAASALDWALMTARLRYPRGSVLEAHWLPLQRSARLSKRTARHEDWAESLRSVVEPAASGFPEVDVIQHVAGGSPEHEILAAASGADLLVVGSHLDRGVGRLQRTVTDRCLHRSPCAIASVPAHSDDRDPAQESPYTVVVGTDGSSSSRNAALWAIDDARPRNGRVRVIHTWTNPYNWQMEVEYPVDETKLRARAEKRLADTLAGVDPGDVPIDAELMEGDPAPTLTEASCDANLLVLGHTQHLPLTRIVRGSISSFCAHHRARPLVVVH
jgi:nucleotide-binding universal stress UspA family protein